MIKKQEGVAVITGGSSGIGAGFAKEFAEQGYDLLLIARDKKKMETFVAHLQERFPIKIESMLADLGDKAQLAQVEDKISKIKNLEILVNCAGYGINKEFLHEEIDKREHMIAVHDIAAVRLSYQALKTMKEQKKGIIINVGSLAGYLGIGNNPIYASSKAFLRNLSENLYRKYKQYGIYVQGLCPGFTATNFAQKGGFSFNGKMSSVEDVVKASVRYFHKKCICIPGRKNKLILFLYRIMPRVISYSINKRLLRHIHN